MPVIQVAALFEGLFNAELHHAEAFGRWDVAGRPLDGELDIRSGVAVVLQVGVMVKVLREVVLLRWLVYQFVEQIDDRSILIRGVIRIVDGRRCRFP